MKMRLYRIPYIDVTSSQVIRLLFGGQVQEGGEEDSASISIVYV